MQESDPPRTANAASAACAASRAPASPSEASVPSVAGSPSFSARATTGLGASSTMKPTTLAVSVRTVREHRRGVALLSAPPHFWRVAAVREAEPRRHATTRVAAHAL